MPQGMTEEVCRQYEITKNANKNAAIYYTSPDLASLGHPPQRGGREFAKL